MNVGGKNKKKKKKEERKSFFFCAWLGSQLVQTRVSSLHSGQVAVVLVHAHTKGIQVRCVLMHPYIDTSLIDVN